MKTIRNDSPAAVKTTGNGETVIGEAIMPRTRNRSTRDVVNKDKGKQNGISRVLGSGTKDLRNWKRVYKGVYRGYTRGYMGWQ